jgi:hypothetical protein
METDITGRVSKMVSERLALDGHPDPSSGSVAGVVAFSVRCRLSPRVIQRTMPTITEVLTAVPFLSNAVEAYVGNGFDTTSFLSASRGTFEPAMIQRIRAGFHVLTRARGLIERLAPRLLANPTTAVSHAVFDSFFVLQQEMMDASVYFPALTWAQLQIRQNERTAMMILETYVEYNTWTLQALRYWDDLIPPTTDHTHPLDFTAAAQHLRPEGYHREGWDL